MSAAAWSFYHPPLFRSALERLSLILSLIRSYFVAAAHVLLGRPLTGGYICVSRTAHVPSTRAAFAQTAPDLSLQQTNDRGVTATSNDVHRKRLYGKSSFTHTHTRIQCAHTAIEEAPLLSRAGTYLHDFRPRARSSSICCTGPI